MRWLTDRPWRTATAVFVLAVVVRLAFVASLGFHLARNRLVEDDPDYYDIAVSLESGHGYSRPWAGVGPDRGKNTFTAYRTPLWPVVEAAVYRVTGPSPTVGRLLTVLFDALTCVLLAWLGRRLRGPTVGLVAGLLAAVYPPLWIYVSGLYSEPVMTFTVVLALLAAERYRRRRDVAAAAALGLCLGLVTLARPNGLVIALMLIPWVLWLGRDRLGRDRLVRTLRPAAVCLGAVALVVAPWIAYASVQMHEFVPVTTQGGVLLAGDFSDTVIDTSSPRWGYWDYDLIIGNLFSSTSEEAWNHRMLTTGREWIADHPGGTVRALALRTVRYWDLYWGLGIRREVGIPTRHGRLNLAVMFSWWAAIVLAVAGFLRLRRAHELGPWVPALVVFAALAGSGMLLGGATRYRAPAEPVVVLFAATYVVERLGSRRAGPVRSAG